MRLNGGSSLFFHGYESPESDASPVRVRADRNQNIEALLLDAFYGVQGKFS
jgi:hypothetical protein